MTGTCQYNINNVIILLFPRSIIKEGPGAGRITLLKNDSNGNVNQDIKRFKAYCCDNRISDQLCRKYTQRRPYSRIAPRSEIQSKLNCIPSMHDCNIAVLSLCYFLTSYNLVLVLHC